MTPEAQIPRTQIPSAHIPETPIPEAHILQEELALEAMRSLPENRAAAVRAHLESCVLCRWQLAEISGDLALLGMAPGQQPAQDVRQRYLAELAQRKGADFNREREQPLQQQIFEEEDFDGQISGDAGDGKGGEDRIGDRQIGDPQTGQGAGARTGELQAGPGAAPPGSDRRAGKPGARPRGRQWIPWVIVACLAIATAVLAVENAALNDTVHTESTMVINLAAKASRAQQVLETLTSRRAQRIVLTPGKPADQPAGRTTYLPDRGGLIFQATNLRPIPAGKSYELWLVPADGAAPISAGLFRPDGLGAASVVMPPLPAEVRAKAFEVTLENAGGAAKPTEPILLAGNVPGV